MGTPADGTQLSSARMLDYCAFVGVLYKMQYAVMYRYGTYEVH